MPISHPPPINSKKTKNIVLIGPMGTGKSTIGKKLAQLLKMRHIDTDHEIEQRTGVNITTIFEYEGEKGFRQREHSVIGDICKLNNIVVSTGGGAILMHENRLLLKESGIIVYLCASIKSLLARTAHDRKRPLLQTDNPKQTLKELIKEREPLYRSIADIELDTSKDSIRTISNHIINFLKSHQQHDDST